MMGYLFLWGILKTIFLPDSGACLENAQCHEMENMSWPILRPLKA
jgi:hypothetical protein